MGRDRARRSEAAYGRAGIGHFEIRSRVLYSNSQQSGLVVRVGRLCRSLGRMESSIFSNVFCDCENPNHVCKYAASYEQPANVLSRSFLSQTALIFRSFSAFPPKYALHKSPKFLPKPTTLLQSTKL